MNVIEVIQDAVERGEPNEVICAFISMLMGGTGQTRQEGEDALGEALALGIICPRERSDDE